METHNPTTDNNNSDGDHRQEGSVCINRRFFVFVHTHILRVFSWAHEMDPAILLAEVGDGDLAMKSETTLLLSYPKLDKTREDENVMRDLFGSSSSDDDDDGGGGDEKEGEDEKEEEEDKKKENVKPTRKRKRSKAFRNRKLRSSVRSILRTRKRIGKRTAKRLELLKDKVDNEWLEQNRLKHRVKGTLAAFLQTKKGMATFPPDVSAGVMPPIEALFASAVHLLRVQDDYGEKLEAMRKECSLAQTQMQEFFNSIMMMGRDALKPIPPYMPDPGDVIPASFYQMRAIRRDADPQKRFTRRNQQASKAMAKEAASSIPDAARPIKKE